MRLSKSDRRKLDLVLRNRLAPINRLTLSSSMLVALTVTIWLSPEAYARVEDESVEITLEKTFVLEKEDDTVRSYSREELAKELPKGAETVGDAFSGQIVGVIKSVGESRRSAKKIQKHRSSAQSVKDYFAQASVGIDHNNHNSEADPDNIREQIGKESTDAITRETFEKTALWQRIKQGLDFNLDFGKLFGAKKKKQPQSAEGKVRYGLILKEIRPDNDINKARAAVDSSLMEEEMAYAGQAEVEWTIGPITDEPNKKQIFATKRRLANGKEVSEEDLEALREYQAELEEQGLGSDADLEDPLEIEKEAETDATVWQTGVKPSFGGNLKPAGKGTTENLANSKTPGLQITLTQEQGLYEYMTRTAGPGSKAASEHRFKVPVVGTFSIGRRYNDKMEVVSTSAHNVLVTKRLPSVSVHYYEQTDQVVADARLEQEDYTVTAAARTDAGNVSDKQKQKRKMQRGYEMGFSKRF